MAIAVGARRRSTISAKTLVMGLGLFGLPLSVMLLVVGVALAAVVWPSEPRRGQLPPASSRLASR